MSILNNFVNPCESSGVLGSQALGTEVLERNVLAENNMKQTLNAQNDYFDTNGSVLHERGRGKPESFAITVKDLSRSGVKFVTEKNEALEAGANIVITFEFNDNRKTSFIKEATVRNVKGKDVRAEFKTLCGDIALLMHTAL